MLDFIKAKKTYLLLLAVLFVFVTLSETTYSLFLTSNEIAELNYNTGLLDLKFVEDKQITLENMLPIADSAALNLKPYVLKIQNVGSLPYLFDLSLVVTNQDNVIDLKYIKVKVNDGLPNNLFVLGNKISTENVIYPGEEKSFEITVWLDEATPNTELGKNFVAKVVTSGSAVYKTLDASGANRPVLDDGMIPVYYDDGTSSWKIADKTNISSQNKWYDYNGQQWANAIFVKNDGKKVYDITRNNDLMINNFNVNNGNLVIENNYLNIGLSTFNSDNITGIFRLEFNDLSNDKIYIISNNNFSYYYDTKNKKFGFINNGVVVNSESYIVESGKWYLVGYTYDTKKVSFYVNGVKIGTSDITGKINSNGGNFMMATNSSHNVVSKFTIGDILLYNRVLSDNEIATNYKDSIKVISNGLICGYDEFNPMTLSEYYMNKGIGTQIDSNDVIMQMVWIPRYKYRVWNILGDGSSSYDVLNSGVDIVFESDSKTTGEISCTDGACTINSVPVTNADNGKYYTHPAFEDKTGFWVSKYELATSDDDCNNNSQTACASGTLPYLSKGGISTWRNNYLANYYKAVYGDNYQIIKNTEWGAIAYLAHSKYGVCINNACQDIVSNETYVAGANKKDTTTGNIYGIFDMAGGAMEYTMSNYTNNGRLNSVFDNVAISNSDYELYNINTFLLGDATKEILKDNKLWYNNAYDYQNVTDKWIVRGGDGKSYKGIFNFTTMNDSMSDNLSTRITIK